MSSFMSLNFWLNLISVFVLFAIAIGAIQLYKSEMLRVLRAKWIRRRIIPMVTEIQGSMRSLYFEQPTDAYVSESQRRKLSINRANLELVFSRAKPLFKQERDKLEKFLIGLSVISAQEQKGQINTRVIEDSLLLGQQVIHELTELGV